MCCFPFLVVWELCGCTAYRVMETCSDAGSGVFAICCKSLCDAIQDENILKQTWEAKSGGCPLCDKYITLFRPSSLMMLELTNALYSCIYIPFPAGSSETPTSDNTEQVDKKE